MLHGTFLNVFIVYELELLCNMTIILNIILYGYHAMSKELTILFLTNI